MVLGKDKEVFLNNPTPLEFLPNLSQKLGVNFYIKRDDLTNLGMGGNKLRKLEYLLKDAKNKGATMLITQGGVQTNHGRLTAAVAAKYGMKCAILTIGDYPGELSANLLLDRILGAEVIIKKDDGRSEEEQFNDLIKETVDKYEKQGEKVYYIPLGGSTNVGMLGYYECAQEITEQASSLGISDANIITTVGSIGSYMGLMCGLKNERSSLSLTGIAILPFKPEDVEQYFKEVKEEYNLDLDLNSTDFHIEYDYIRAGYNLPSKTVRKAIYLMAQEEAIFLDPCYTGKCFAGILSMIEEGKIKKGQNIIFIHTGGTPGLYTLHHRVEFEKELLNGVTILN